MKLLKWLSVADRFSKAYLDQLLAPLGINSSQHIYLLKVCDHPGISQDALLDIVYVHPSNMVRMVASLEKKGFLTREPCSQDKRTWQLYPTQRALDICMFTEKKLTITGRDTGCSCEAFGDYVMETVRALVPATTYDYFTSDEAAPVLERIRKAGNVVHY